MKSGGFPAARILASHGDERVKVVTMCSGRAGTIHLEAWSRLERAI